MTDTASYEQIKRVLAPNLPDNLAVAPPAVGRPMYHGERLVKVTVSIPPEYRDYIREAGGGNMSLGTRNIVTRDMAQQEGVVHHSPSAEFSLQLYRRAVAKLRDNKELRELEPVLVGAEYWLAGDEYWMWVITAPVTEILETINRIMENEDDKNG
jgi:hypothetical protein